MEIIMKKQNGILMAMGTAIVAASLLMVGCSADGEADERSLTSKTIDKHVVTMAESIIEAIPATIKVEEVEAAADNQPGIRFGNFTDLLQVGTNLYATYDGGVVVYDLVAGEMVDIRCGEKFSALASYNDQIFVGGERLYTILDNDLNPVEMELEGAVKSMANYEYQLIVGTESGLYNYSIFGSSQVMEDVTVSSLAADLSGVWVGTDGQGLYRWNGTEFKKRYLKRDETLFDRITSLAYGHNHTYVGTADGLYIYDGGSWQTLTAADGLPEGTVRSVDASGWVVYIGTDQGVVSYFENDFIPVKKLSDKGGQALLVKARNIYVGTDRDGLLMKTGPALKTLVAPTSSGGNETVAASF